MESDDAIVQSLPTEAGDLGPSTKGQDRRTLILLSFVMLIVVSNVSGMTIALPSIKNDLKLSDASFVWVTNAYSVTYGGALLLCGRLGDLIGHRSIYAWGLALFIIASLACGISSSPLELIAARSIQGIAGAALSTATLALIARIFHKADERTRAVGTYVFACSAGGLIGLFLSGVLTGALNWRCIFLANLPPAMFAYILHTRLLPDTRPNGGHQNLDLAGAVTATLTVSLAVYAVINATRTGWLSGPTAAAFLGVVIALTLFTLAESRAARPLVPLSIFRNQKLMRCCIVNLLYAAAVLGSVIISLYLQGVLGYSPLQAGMAFIPASIATATFALGFSAKLVLRYGTKGPLLLGLCACGGGFTLFARAPINANFIADVLPGLILIGIGAGLAYNPLLVEALKCLPEQEAGTASGVITTSTVIGNTLGLAILAGVAAARSSELSGQGVTHITALYVGYHAAFFTAAVAASASALATILYFPHSNRTRYSDA